MRGWRRFSSPRCAAGADARAGKPGTPPAQAGASSASDTQPRHARDVGSGEQCRMHRDPSNHRKDLGRDEFKWSCCVLHHEKADLRHVKATRILGGGRGAAFVSFLSHTATVRLKYIDGARGIVNRPSVKRLITFTRTNHTRIRDRARPCASILSMSRRAASYLGARLTGHVTSPLRQTFDRSIFTTLPE